jgi:hypothetical protein
LSSLLDVPAQLALALSLAAATAANEPLRAPIAGAPASPVSVAAIAVEPAQGPYRFSEGMWLRALKEDLPEDPHGYARSIFRTSGGRYYVPRQAERRQILDARDDGALAARAARAFARSNARALRSSLERAPTAGELLIAHLFGPEAAAGLIARAHSHPGDAAAKHVPELAQRAHELLGARGSTLTLAQLYARLTQPLDRARLDASGAPRAPTIVDMLQHGAAWGALRPNAIAWQTEVSTAPPQ